MGYMSNKKTSKLFGLLIGVDYYPKANPADCRPLSCAVNDAELAFELLNSGRDECHIQLLVNRDATTENLNAAVERIATEIESDDSLLIMFCGHGVPVKYGDRWEAVCLLSDYSDAADLIPKPKTGCFMLPQIWDVFNKKQKSPSNIVVLLDSCFSGTAITHSISDTHLDTGRASIQARGARVNGDRPDGHVDLDRMNSWPPKSSVCVMSAANMQCEFAYEDLELGHGLFSYLVLEWWMRIIRQRLPIRDLAEELGKSVREEAEYRVRRGASKWKALTDIQTLRRGRVSFGSEPHWHGLNRQSRDLQFDALFSARPREDEFHAGWSKNEERIKEALSWRINSVEDSNILFVGDRFMSIRYQVAAVARAMQKEFDRQGCPILTLGASYLVTSLPFVCTLWAWRLHRWDQYSRINEPPHIEMRHPLVIDSLVDRLAHENAIVIVPYRELGAAEEVLYFLKRCAATDKIRLCLLVHFDENIPSMYRVHRFKRVELLPKSIELTDSGTRVLSPRILSWLEHLELQQLPDANARMLTQDNHTVGAIFFELATKVIQLLDREDDDLGESSRLLLQILSVVRLPRTYTLIELIWTLMCSWFAEQFDASNVRVEQAVELLKKLHLIDESTDENDPHFGNSGTTRSQETKAAHGELYFVHDTVQQASLADLSACDMEERHAIAALAFREALKKRSKHQGELIRWPAALMAHQAIRHFNRANLRTHAARVLNRNWKALVDAGFQENVLDWAESYYVYCMEVGLRDDRIEQTEDCLTTPLPDLLELLRSFTVTSIPDLLELLRSLTATSIPDLLELLKSLQSLRRHRQEFDEVLHIHDRIVRITQDHFVDGKLISREKHMDHFWHSLSEVGDYYLVSRDYIRALSIYAACLSAAVESDDYKRIQSVLFRSAQCFVDCGDFENANRVLDRYRRNMVKNSKGKPADRGRLTTVTTDMARLRENAEFLYDEALEGWVRALSASLDTNEFERNSLNIAISRIHMGWAALLRGEAMRSWRHCLQARQLLNQRGITEYWWIGEVERMGALAIAWHLKSNDAPRLDSWIDASSIGSDRQFAHEDAEQQLKYLDQIRKKCEPNNVWRAFEVANAQGQLLHRIGRLSEARKVLRLAFEQAVQANHAFLAGYALEALAQLDDHRKIERWTEAAEIAAGLGLNEVARRRLKNRDWLQYCELPTTGASALAAKLRKEPKVDAQTELFELGLRSISTKNAKPRLHKRYPCRWPVIVHLRPAKESKTISLEGMLLDLSENGIGCLLRSCGRIDLPTTSIDSMNVTTEWTISIDIYTPVLTKLGNHEGSVPELDSFELSNNETHVLSMEVSSYRLIKLDQLAEPTSDAFRERFKVWKDLYKDDPFVWCFGCKFQEPFDWLTKVIALIAEEETNLATTIGDGTKQDLAGIPASE